MIHRRVGRKLNRTWSHKKALMCNLATDLFLHKKLVTTEAKAKELRPFAESLITRAIKQFFKNYLIQLLLQQQLVMVDIHASSKLVAVVVMQPAKQSLNWLIFQPLKMVLFVAKRKQFQLQKYLLQHP